MWCELSNFNGECNSIFPRLYNESNYLSMLGFMSIHVRKGDRRLDLGLSSINFCRKIAMYDDSMAEKVFHFTDRWICLKKFHYYRVLVYSWLLGYWHHTDEQTVEEPVIWDVMTVMWLHGGVSGTHILGYEFRKNDMFSICYSKSTYSLYIVRFQARFCLSGTALIWPSASWLFHWHWDNHSIIQISINSQLYTIIEAYESYLCPGKICLITINILGLKIQYLHLQYCRVSVYNENGLCFV